ncbi:hypothetical protein [Neolewinella antarctica]|uniref:BioF2-like acetyltransferase domain-containing protein n=1 Tax=Neolewinella antarctica TaxID=442734 RepID=A0ABX0X6B4_9BACT|nr:hypothetical protein [Neolewinella antarctica]NJC24751.1 hypothetical protein [Neolewinella antarctica]
MSKKPLVHFVKHRNIDRARWDATVASDDARLPYGFTWWLDVVTNERWDGLVLDDYRAVMPLPYTRKIGPLSQVSSPAFTQQCGPWGDSTDTELALFLSSIPKTAIKVAIPLREASRIMGPVPGFTARERTNFVLDMAPGHASLSRKFSKSLRRNLRRHPGGVMVPVTVEEVISVYAASAGEKAGLSKKHYEIMRNLARACSAREMSIITGFEDDDGQLLACGFFPHYRGRFINSFGSSTDLGYDRVGMSRLLDGLIKNQAGPGKLLDFEGSDLPGVAEYFNSFRPRRTAYQQLVRSAW